MSCSLYLTHLCSEFMVKRTLSIFRFSSLTSENSFDFENQCYFSPLVDTHETFQRNANNHAPIAHIRKHLSINEKRFPFNR